MNSFKIIPALGLKTNVPENDPTLFKFITEGLALVHCVDGINVDFSTVRNACSKSKGKTMWSNSANSQATKCLGMFEYYDGSNRDKWFADNGHLFRYDSARDPQRMCDTSACAGSPVIFATGDSDLYSFIQYGNYTIFTDMGEHTPYKAAHSDTEITKLIQSGTEYKFKYLEQYQRRIIGCYTDQTNGDLEVRWTDTLPTWGSLSFKATNQLFKPNDDKITGIKRFGGNACFLYGENSIDRIDYYPSFTAPFGIVNMVAYQGSVNQASLIDFGDRHYIFNKNYGFCEYRGGSEFPFGGKPISEDIEEDISGIGASYHDLIVGAKSPHTNEAVWAVPLGGAGYSTHLAFYNYLTQSWRFEKKAARYIDSWVIATDLTWNDIIALGYTTWNDFGNSRWVDFISSRQEVVLAETDGHTYYIATEADAGSDLDGYRVEPVLDFGRPNDKDMLLEIWFDIVNTGSYSMYVSYRGGNTLAEVKNSSWIQLGEVSFNDPANAITRLAEVNRFHQIKYGTDGANEPFVINGVEFRYSPQGRY